MSDVKLDAVLSELSKLSKQFGKFDTRLKGLEEKVDVIAEDIDGLKDDMTLVRKDISGLQDTMRKVLKCVSVENADFPDKNNMSKLKTAHKS